MASITKPILDFLAMRGSDARIIDLSTVFSGTDLTYTVTTSDGGVAAARIEDGKLIIDSAGGLGIADLKITATEAGGGSVTDNVRVTYTGENAYTIAVLPDTQDYTNAARVSIFEGMTNWLVDNKDSLGLQFVIHVGDITTNNSDTSHWPFAEQALRILDGKLPYSLLPGNHDQNTGNAANHSTTPLDTRFSPEKQAATNPGTFGGVYDMEPTRSANNYHTFTAPDGTKWMVLSLEFGPRDDVLRWADEVIESHLDHRVILANHSYMNWAGRHDATGAPLYDEGTGYDYGMGSSVHGANDGETMYRELIQKHPNVTFTFSGHIFGDGAETLVSYDQFGNPVHQMMVNYQNGVASEITSDAGQGSGGNGGNGAIRLLTIDPENGNVYTSTYFSALDDYMDSVRGDGELDRDGLTGPYRGHQETLTDLDLGTPEVAAIAKAGNDQFVTAAEGQEKAAVTLDGDWTLNPGSDQGLDYVWTDRDGNVVAEGATPTIQLGAGQHQLNLTVTDSAGHVSTDDVRIVVSNAGTLLADNFNDGNATGWTAGITGPAYTTKTTADYGIAAIPGTTGNAAVTYLPKLAQADGGVHIKLEDAGGAIAKSYSLVYDLMVTPGVQSYFSFLQTDIANTSDQDLAMKHASGNTGGIGINSDYEGTINYGSWHRVAFTVTDLGDRVRIDKYIDGVKVGDTIQQGGNYGRYAIDMEKGFLLFADESNETWPGYASSFLFTDKVLTADEISALGGVKAGGIMATKPSENSVQIDFSKSSWTDTFSEGSANILTLNNSGTGTFLVKGSAATRTTTEDGQDAPEGRVFEQSDATGKMLVWSGSATSDWNNYEFEATIKTTDNDGVGLVFYYENARNHYKVVLDAETNTQSLVKVSNGTETVLASEFGGTPWSRDFQLKTVVVDGKISVFLDGESLFGEVVDTAPLTGGSVGFYSNNQRSSQFDNATVNKVTLGAHAGENVRPVDADGDGKVTVDLDASGTYGLAEITSYVWTDKDGKTVATGESASISLDAIKQTLTLTVTDANGKTATDTVVVDAISKDRVMLSDSFSGSTYSAWTIVDEGEMGGVGVNGTASQWELQDGALTQLTSLASRQLTWNGASNSNPWQTGWSPLGDGVNVLRKGTYALYNDAEAKEWADYSVEATIESPDNGAAGLLFYYQDANNYYKLEVDANGDYDRSPGNGAGSLFQLIQVKDGVEKYLNQFPAKYTPNEAFTLRVDVVDGKIQAYVDDQALFAYAIEDRAQTKGTIGLFSWDNAGVSFDDVRVVSLASASAPINQAPVAGDDSGYTTAYGALLTIAAASLLANDADADNDTLAIDSVTSVTGGTVTLDQDGNVVFTPATGFSGEASFTYTVTDGKGGTDTATVTLVVRDQQGGGGNPNPNPNPNPQPDPAAIIGTSENIIKLTTAPAIGSDGKPVATSGTAQIDEISSEFSLRLGADAENAVLMGSRSVSVWDNAGDNVIYGNAGNNAIILSGGDDVVDGGAGYDVLVLSGARGDYTIDLSGSFARIVNTETGEIVHAADIQGVSFNGRIVDPVLALTEAVLGRAPTEAEYASATEALKSGASVSDVAAGFIGSAEGQANLASGSDADFVSGLYRSVFDREAGAAEVAFWADELGEGNVSRADLAVSLIESDEFGQSFAKLFTTDQADIAGIYDVILGRDVDAAGMTYWSQQSATGETLKAILDGFYYSEEFQQRLAESSSEDLLTEFYRDLFDREPDAAGLAYWLNEVEQDQTAFVDVVQSFIQSSEFRVNIDTLLTRSDWVDMI